MAGSGDSALDRPTPTESGAGLAITARSALSAFGRGIPHGSFLGVQMGLALGSATRLPAGERVSVQGIVALPAKGSLQGFHGRLNRSGNADVLHGCFDILQAVACDQKHDLLCPAKQF